MSTTCHAAVLISDRGQASIHSLYRPTFQNEGVSSGADLIYANLARKHTRSSLLAALKLPTRPGHHNRKQSLPRLPSIRSSTLGLPPTLTPLRIHPFTQPYTKRLLLHETTAGHTRCTYQACSRPTRTRTRTSRRGRLRMASQKLRPPFLVVSYKILSYMFIRPPMLSGTC